MATLEQKHNARMKCHGSTLACKVAHKIKITGTPATLTSKNFVPVMKNLLEKTNKFSHQGKMVVVDKEVFYPKKSFYENLKRFFHFS